VCGKAGKRPRDLSDDGMITEFVFSFCFAIFALQFFALQLFRIAVAGAAAGLGRGSRGVPKRADASVVPVPYCPPIALRGFGAEVGPSTLLNGEGGFGFG